MSANLKGRIMKDINIILTDELKTVVEEYTPLERTQVAYQSEADLEKKLIKDLQAQGYEYIRIQDEIHLIDNIRKQQEELNNVTFTDREWNDYYKNYIQKNPSVINFTNKIQNDYIYTLNREDGSQKNLYLVDKKNIHNNLFQIINQYKVEGRRKNRYDVTILINGLPLVHIELKRRGIPIKEAFNQIKRYENDTFWAGDGLFQYVQLFIISNGVNTKYYSNTVREAKFKEIKKKAKESKSFEFTSYWADSKNKNILDLEDFTKTFFEKKVILNVLFKYCVFDTDNILKVMRPYQIVATERILNKIRTAHSNKLQGSIDAGGFIWHTTGSGKTLTSFKTAQISTGFDFVDKVLFVVDRKDLDYQTIKEYEKFQKDCVSGSKNTKELEKKLDTDNLDDKIIVTTIQKLNAFIKKNKEHGIYTKNVVLIFDECHRSQFGDMHKSITDKFKKYYIFGFTGTPIFAENSTSNNAPDRRTTFQLFGKCLHAYTIVNAISDKNVLPFNVEYYKTINQEEEIIDEMVKGIDRTEAYENKERAKIVVDYVLDHYRQKTKGRFNSIFAASSIPMAIIYYDLFKKEIESRGLDLKIATIFSYSANGVVDDEFFEDEELEADGMDLTHRDFLDKAIKDYNKTFGDNYSSDSFENYYKDISKRVKANEIDILIVVNMFLTGFDAPNLNTLWCDKFLRQHGLIQAFSRTNRILDSVKTYGNIVCFRNIKLATDRAIKMFGTDNPNAHNIILMRTFNEYYEGFTKNDGSIEEGYKKRVEKLIIDFPIGDEIIGEENKKQFIKKYNAILKLKNILTAFDEFTGKEILSPYDFQSYQGKYIDIKDEAYSPEGEVASILEDITFEVELIAQDRIDVDYILKLIDKLLKSGKSDKNVLDKIETSIKSSEELRHKKDLIMNFINAANCVEDTTEQWNTYVAEQKESELNKIITEEKLKPEETKNFMDKSFKEGRIDPLGPEIPNLMAERVGRFTGKGNRQERKNNIIGKLLSFFERFFGI